MLMNPSSEHQENQLLTKILMELESIHKTLQKNHVQTLDELNEQTALLKEIADGLAPEPLTHSAPIITGDSMANNTYVMNVGQSQPGVITPLLADGTTPSGGTVSNTVVTFTDPSATFAVSADGLTITFTGVAASTGAVSGSVAFTVTDTDGVASKWTDAITVTVNAPPAQLTQSAPIVVGTATP